MVKTFQLGVVAKVGRNYTTIRKENGDVSIVDSINLIDPRLLPVAARHSKVAKVYKVDKNRKIIYLRMC